MSPDTPRLRRSSISRRLVGGLALLSLLVSVATTFVQLEFDYQRRVDLLKADTDARAAALSPSLARTVWNVDPASIRLLLDGLVRTPGIARAQLRTLDGEEFAAGRTPAHPIDQRRFELHYPDASTRPVGTLAVTLDDRDIRFRVAGRLRAIALTTVAVVVAGCLFIFLLYRRLVMRHLERIARYARQLDLEHLDRPLVLDRHGRGRSDELDLVVAGFDRMRARMSQELAVRERHESELERHRNQLEELVRERTQQLDDARARAEALANTDHLTGLGNRRHFYATAQTALAEAFSRIGDQGSVGALMIDIDRFKQVNDRYGHASGDRVIAEVAKRLRNAMPAGALVGRLGGEEFAALLSPVDLPTLQQLAERVRADVEAAPIPIGVLGPLSCTVSIGLAMGDGALSGIDDLLGYADDALYRAKESGRNRVVAWMPGDRPSNRPSQVRRREDAPD
jgi:diguanylate cyclase (GGDEF)-like protein